MTKFGMTDYPNHKDTGCKEARQYGYHGPCIECPFNDCHEVTGIPEFRNHIAKDLYNQGLTPKKIAEMLKVSRRTIYIGLGRG